MTTPRPPGAPGADVRRAPGAAAAAVVAVLVVALGCGGGSGGSGAATTGAPTTTAVPQPSVDRTFGDGGVVELSLGPGYAEATDVEVDRSGRVVVAGVAPGGGGVLVRLTPDGRPDPAFGDDGRVPVPFDTGARAVALAADGAVLTTGAVDGALAVARFDEAGRPDARFGRGGSVLTSFDHDATGEALAAGDDGSIVVAGHTGDPTDLTVSALVLVRYGADGALDRGFASSGRLEDPSLSGVWGAGGLHVSGDGRVVVGATVERSAAGEPAQADVAVRRFTPDGRPDASFGRAGLATVDLGGPLDRLRGLTAGPDGAVVVVGETDAPTGATQVATARLTAGGGPDAAFGSDGVTRVAAAPLSLGRAVVVDPRGGAVVVALVADDRTRSDTAWEWAVLRLGGDGSPGGGADEGAAWRSGVGRLANAAALQPDGRLVVAGCTCPFPPTGRGGHESDSSLVVARFALAP